MLKTTDHDGGNSYQGSYPSHTVSSRKNSTAVEQRRRDGKTDADNPRDLTPKVTPKHIDNNGSVARNIEGYRISLSNAATGQEIKGFTNYQKETIDAGWSFIAVHPEETELAAYLVTRKGSQDEMYVAASVASLELKNGLEGAYGALR